MRRKSLNSQRYPKTFRQVKSAINSIQFWLSIPGEKRYKCDVCSKAFTESSTLRKHMLVHNPNPPQFQCNDCGRTFSRKINLNEHMKTHYRNKGEPLEGDDLHECMVCLKVIRNASNFKKHMKIHTGMYWTPLLVVDRQKCSFIEKLQVKKCIHALYAMLGSINPTVYVHICQIIPARRIFNVQFVRNCSVCRIT